MADKKHFIPIWFFIGLLLTIYGVLILGSGVYELISPPAAEVQSAIELNVMANLHAAILDRQTAIGRTLIRCEQRVALDDADSAHGYVEFLGHDLSDGRSHTGT